MIEYWNSFVAFLTKILFSIFGFFHDFFFWIIDGLFTMSQTILGTLVVSLNGLNPVQYISAIPESTRGMMALVGFNESMSIIIAAILIRFVLQLIPFVRWGS